MRHDYQCGAGHVTEVEVRAGESPPERVDCGFVRSLQTGEGATSEACGLTAERVWSPPAIRHDRRLHHGRPRSAT